MNSIAIIPDGNRRFSKKNDLSLQSAYLAGFKKVEQAMKWADDEGVKRMSFWALSLENFKKRSSQELGLIFGLMDQRIRDALGGDNDFSVKFAGRLDLLPKWLSKEMVNLEEKTSGRERELVVAVAYSGRDEIVNAAKKLAGDIASGAVTSAGVNEETFSKYLYLNYSPDLVIRTGGVSRLSGFLPFQTAYSELFFSKRLWPEFTKKDFGKAVDFFYSTDRRFGK